MCHGDSSRPPLPPISGAAADQGDFVLTSADGTEFSAYFARASKPTGAGMVVMPDVRGLHAFYKELAVRFAETGIDAVAIDYFGRTAGMGDRRWGSPRETRLRRRAAQLFRPGLRAVEGRLRRRLAADPGLREEAQLARSP